LISYIYFGEHESVLNYLMRGVPEIKFLINNMKEEEFWFITMDENIFFFRKECDE
jgi:hypothetical protein